MRIYLFTVCVILGFISTCSASTGMVEKVLDVRYKGTPVEIVLVSVSDLDMKVLHSGGRFKKGGELRVMVPEDNSSYFISFDCSYGGFFVQGSRLSTNQSDVVVLTEKDRPDELGLPRFITSKVFLSEERAYSNMVDKVNAKLRE